ncbi:MAG: hypothetical protein U5K38_01820 [Woeseiaceae bacterium]|nr:hypothetical protein [Woeseiaceae bacterium]
MSNHYHVVLHLNAEQLDSWDDEEVIARWQRLHRLPDGFDTVDPAREPACFRSGASAWAA